MFFFRAWCCSGPWVRPRSGQMMGRGVCSTQMSLGDVAEVGAPCRHLWTFHHVPCTLLPPAPSPWGPFPCMQGWQTGTSYSVVSGDTGEVTSVHCKAVRCRRCWQRRRQPCEPCALCLTCRGLGCRGTEVFHFLLRPEAQMRSVPAWQCPAGAQTPASPFWAQFE